MRRQAITGATSYEIVDNYVPEYLCFKKTTGNLPTAIKVIVGGSTVIVDVDLAAAKFVSSLRKFADMTATYLKLPLANGFMKNKNIQIMITCGATTDVNDVYFYNETPNGDTLIRTIRQKIFQTSGMKFSKFGALYVDTAANTDNFKIKVANGQSHNAYLDEIYLEQYEKTNANLAYCIFDNLDQQFSEVEIIPAADRYVTVMDFLLN